MGKCISKTIKCAECAIKIFEDEIWEITNEPHHSRAKKKKVSLCEPCYNTRKKTIKSTMSLHDK